MLQHSPLLKLCLFLLSTLTASFSFAQKSAYFDGSDRAHVQYPPVNSEDVRTVEFWINPDNVTGKQAVWSYQAMVQYADGWFDTDARVDVALEIGIDGEHPYFTLNRNSHDNVLGAYEKASAKVPKGEWSHLAFTYDEKTLYIYLNGEEVLKKTINENIWALGRSKMVSIGTTSTYEYEHALSFEFETHSNYKGHIDELRVWNVVRSQQEIIENRHREISLPATGLVQYYKFEYLDDDWWDWWNDYLIDEVSNTVAEVDDDLDWPGTFDDYVDGADSDPSIVTDIPDFYNGGNYIVLDFARLSYLDVFGINNTNWHSKNGDAIYFFKVSPTISAAVGIDTWQDAWSLNVFDTDNKNGSLDLQFDFSSNNALLSQLQASSYVLLYAAREGDDFKEVPITGSHLSNSILNFRINGEQVKTGLYTLGWKSNTPGGAIALDGINDHITGPSINLGSTDFTVEFWAKKTGSSVQPLFTHDSISSNSGIYMAIDVQGQKLIVQARGEEFEYESPLFAENNWNHYAMAYKKADKHLNVFVNGNVIIDTNLSTPYVADENFYLGYRNKLNFPLFFQGLFDECRIWNTAINQVKVRENMYRCFTDGTAGLLFQTRFDQNRTQTNGVIADRSGNLLSANVFEGSTKASEALLYPLSALASPLSGGFAMALGGSDHVEIVDDGEYALESTGMTVEAWVKPRFSSNSYDAAVISKRLGNGRGFSLSIEGGKPVFTYESTAGVTIEKLTGATNLPLSQWTHLAATYSSNEITLFVNGVPQASKSNPAAMVPGSGALVIGKNALANDQYFSGQIDEVRLWDYKRSMTQIMSSYGISMAGLEEGIALLLNFDINKGSSIIDASAYQNNGTLNGTFSQELAEWSAFREVNILYTGQLSRSYKDGLSITASGFFGSNDDVIAFGRNDEETQLTNDGDGLTTLSRSWNVNVFDAGNDFTNNYQLEFVTAEMNLANLSDFLDYTPRLLYRASLTDEYEKLNAAGTLKSGNAVLFELGAIELANGYYTLAFEEKAQGLALAFSNKSQPVTVINQSQLVTDIETAVGFTSDGITLQAWVRPPNQPSSPIDYFGFKGSGTNFFMRQLAGSQDIWLHYGHSSSSVDSFKAGTLAANTWQHITLTLGVSRPFPFSSSFYNVAGCYINGASAANESYLESNDPLDDTPLGNSQLFVGDKVPGDTLKVDELRLFTLALNSGQVADYWLKTDVSNDLNIVGLYGFNEIGTTISDASGQGNHLSNSQLQKSDWVKANWLFKRGTVEINKTTSSNSSGGLKITAGSALLANSDFERITWSYNAGDFNLTRERLSDHLSQRIKRFWHIEKYKDHQYHGAIDFSFDIDELGLAPIKKNSDYLLLYAADLTSKFEPLPLFSATLIDSTEIQFQGNLYDMPSGYYTLGMTSPRSDYALPLNGTNQNFVSTARSEFALNDSFSIAFWLRLTEKGLAQPLLTFDQQEISVTSNNELKFNCIGSSSNSTFTNSKSKLDTGVWYHVGFSYNQGNANFILNGSLEGNTTGVVAPAYNSANPTVKVGSNYSRNTYSAIILDELSIWNRKLDTLELQEYSKQNFWTTERGLVAYWRFNEPYTFLYHDRSNTESFLVLHESGIPRYNTIAGWKDASNKLGTYDLNDQKSLKGSGSIESGGLTLSNPKKGGFLHDAGDDISLAYTGVTNGIISAASRFSAKHFNVSETFSRIWLVDVKDEFGNGGQLDFTFDFSKAGITESVNPDRDYYLAYSCDGETDWNIEPVLRQYVNIEDNQVTFTANVANFGSGYFSLAQSEKGWGQGLSLDGANDYIELGNLNEMNWADNDPFTILIQLTPTGAGTIFSKTLGENKGIALSVTSDQYLEAEIGANKGTLLSLRPVSLNESVAVALVYDGDSIKLFTNGSRNGVSSVGNLLDATHLEAYIGTNSTSGKLSEFLPGTLHDFRVYNRALEVYEFYNTTQANSIGSDSLIYNLRFNQAEGKRFGGVGTYLLSARIKNSSTPDWISGTSGEYILSSVNVNQASATTSTASGQVNELTIASDTTGNQAFFKKPDDNVFFGYLNNNMVVDNTQIPTSLKGRYQAIWKVNVNDYQGDGGTIEFRFKGSDQWAGPDKKQDYFLLFTKNKEKDFKLIPYKKYTKTISDSTVSFQIDALQLRSGYYALGFVDGEQLLTASDTTSDANINVSYKIPAHCLLNIGGKPVKLEMENSQNKVVYELVLDSFSLNSFYRDSFVYYTDSGYTETFNLNIYRIGSGQKVCEDLFRDTGRTKGHVPPQLSISKESIDRVELTWQGQSDHTNKYRLIRIGQNGDSAVTFIDSTETRYTDSIHNGAKSLENGQTYTYQLQVQSTRLPKFFQATQVIARTVAVDFSATDAQLKDSVLLSWNNISTHCDQLQITRDGRFYASLDAEDTSFIDHKPIHGKRHEYGLDIYRNNVLLFSPKDTGYVKPVGKLGGRITTLSGNYAVPNVKVVVEGFVIDSTLRYETLTDETGHFELDGLYFGVNTTFSVTPSKSGHSFERRVYTVGLSSGVPQQLDVDMKSLHVYQGNGTRKINGFALDAKNYDNHNRLEWSYSTSHQTLFQIYRDDTLKSIVSDTTKFDDLAVVPGKKHQYEVNAYILSGDTISERSAKDTLTSGQIKPINTKGFQAFANKDKATVQLSWEYDYSNFDGFSVYRNGAWIADVNQKVYEDWTGTNGSLYQYAISAFKHVEGKKRESSKRTVSATYPNLAAPTSLKLSASVQEGSVKGNFLYKVPGNYNYTGLRVYAVNGTDTHEVADIYKGRSFIFADTSGDFSTKYSYLVAAYKNDPKNQSAFLSGDITFPAFAKHTLASHTELTNAVNSYSVTWNSQTNLYSGTRFITDTDTLWLPKGRSALNYSVLPAKGGSTTKYQELRAFVWRNGKRVFSDSIKLSTTLNGLSAQLNDVSDFIASNEFSGFVQLSWDYPDYIRPEFRIYRDGQLIDSVGYQGRTYSDFDATPGKTHAYMIQAVYPKDNPNAFSQYAIAYGEVNSKYLIYGEVRNKYSANGLPEVTVRARGRSSKADQFDVSTKTDSTGYYEMEVPVISRALVGINATLQNLRFPVQQFNFADTILSYRVDFVDTTMEAKSTGNTIAEIENLTVSANETSQSISIRFNLSNRNYTGVLITRGNKEIANLRNGDGHSFIDADGVPGFTYVYSVRTYWELNTGTIYSQEKSRVIDYPTIKAPTRFFAQANDSLNHVKLEWAHPNDRLDHYIITRNGEQIAKVKFGNYVFYDETGKPGQLYRYAVLAQSTSKGNVINSESLSAKATYPYLPRVYSPMAAALPDSNAVKLSWEYNVSRIEGYIIQRNGIRVDTVQQQTGQSSFTYFDRYGLPGQRNQYTITPYFTLENGPVNGVPALASAIYPKLKAPQQLVGIPKEGEDKVNLLWEYEFDNIDGFIVYRNGDEISRVNNATRFYEDDLGLPGVNYTYSVVAYAIRSRSVYTSNQASVTERFPVVGKPSKIKASTYASQIHILLDWKHDGWLQSFSDERGYEIEYANWTVDYSTLIPLAGTTNKPDSNSNWIPLADISYTDRYYVHEHPALQIKSKDISAARYRIRAYRKLGGVTYYSNYEYTDKYGISLESEDDRYQPASFNATKGDNGAFVKLTWDDKNTSDAVFKAYKIYRKGYDATGFELIATIAKETEVYNDDKGVAGKKYIYEIRPELTSTPANSINPQRGSVDIGWRNGNGSISGSAIVSETSSALEGVEIEASAKVGKELFLYETQTDENGRFTIGNIFFGNATDYSVNATYLDHEFSNPTQTASLSESFPNASLDPFVDLNAFTVEGRVVYKGTECGIDSVRMVVRTYFNDGTSSETEQYTDEKGEYAIVYNPRAQNVRKVEAFADTVTIFSSRPTVDTVYHNFDESTLEINNPLNVGTTTEFNVNDLSITPVNVAMVTACGPLPHSTRYNVLVQSKSGCFNRTIETNTNGHLKMDLPPGKYDFSIIGASPVTQQNYPYVQYFSTLSKNVTVGGSDTQKVQFVYHKKPVIKYKGLNQFCGNDASNPAVISTENPVSLQFEVIETHGTTCNVTDGYLIVYNEAVKAATGFQKTQETRIFPDENGGLPAYVFIPDNPNVTAPFSRTIRVEYHTNDLGFQSELLIPVIVEGTAIVDGNDVVVNPAENGDVQLPLFVLRDPPGDGSYSYIEAGTTFEQELEISEDYTRSKGVDFENKFTIEGFGIGVSLSYDYTQEYSGSYGLTVSTSIDETISTMEESEILNKAASDFLVGENADVIVGSGLASQSGLSWKIEVEPGNSCKVKKLSTYATGIGDIKTTWVYTVDHIEGLINEYDSLYREVQRGNTLFEGKTREETLSEISSYISNWQQVLDYHRNETLPQHALCDNLNYNELPQPWEKYLISDDNPFYTKKDYEIGKFFKRQLVAVPDAYKANVVRVATESFCKDIGTYTDDGFQINDDFEWTSDKINAYNGIYAMVNNWGADTALFLETLNQFDIDGDLSDDYWTKNYTNRVYPEAENVTFAGGATITKEFSSSTSKSNSKMTATTHSVAASLGLVWDIENKKVVTFKKEGHVKATANLEFTYGNSIVAEKTSDNIIGYVLSDDDPGDQYSVTIIRGIHSNHSPYFSLLGGRSSCPFEEGTIDRDQYSMELADSVNGSPTQRFLDPDEPAVFKMKIVNLSPYNESRWFGLYQNTNSNRKGARMEVYGNRIGATPVDFFLQPNKPEYFNLYVYRAPGVYAHEDIVPDLMVDCDDYFHHRLVRLKAYWQHECTDVDIISPGGWVINQNYHGKEQTLIELGGYDVDNDQLLRVMLQYRRVGENDWTVFKIIPRDSLKDYYERYRTSPPLPPRYPVSWNISNSLIPDGAYEIMASYVCTEAGTLNSNVVTGWVNRSAFTLQGIPSPSDGILSIGEEIEATYNKDIDCGSIPYKDIHASYLDKGQLRDLQLPVVCRNNRLSFMLSDSMRSVLHNKKVVITIDSLYDLNGNNQAKQVKWSFTISNNPAYWQPSQLVYQAYSDRRPKTTAQLQFARFENALPYSLSFGKGTWARVLRNKGTLGLNGEAITIAFNTHGMPAGTYRDTLWARIGTYPAIPLPIELKVTHKAPYWTVDANKYEQSLHVISNFELDNNGLLSTDTMDRIAAYIGSELRGVGHIMQFGGFHAAYIPVYGNATDQGAEIQFRVWDASSGILYVASPAGGKIHYDAKFPLQGSFSSPRILQIETDKDSVRMIPLKAGWNWISTNLKQKSVENTMRSLSLDDGDLIKTAKGTSEYSSQFGTGLWLSTTGLSHIKPSEGYQLFLNQRDTLYLSGDTATTQSITILSGWNLIGYPRQTPQNLPKAFSTNKALQDGDVMYNQNELALFEAGQWTGPLTQMRPYQSYRVKMGNATRLSFKKTPRPESWEVNATDFEYNMTVTGRIVLNGNSSFDTTDLVGAFMGDELRGLGHLTHLKAINKYRLTLFIYSDSISGEEISLKIYDSDQEILYEAHDKIAFNADQRLGKMSDPYLFSNEPNTGIDVNTYYGIALNAYPNPFNKQVTLRFEDQASQHYQLIVQNAMGQQVWSQAVTSSHGENNLLLDFDQLNLKDGVYFVRLEGSNSLGTLRIIKQ